MTERGRNKRDSEPPGSVQRPKKKAKTERPVIASPLLLLLDCSCLEIVVDTIRANVEGGLGRV